MAHLVDIIKYEGDNSTFVWKHPKEDFNTHSQLIVHESQEAIFLANGQALGTYGPGRYDLETQNMPFLSRFFKKLSSGETAFHCEVYFINKTVQMAIKWGTPELIKFIEPTLGIPLGIGASGTLNLAVSDSRKLLVKLVGTMNGIAWEERENDNFTKSIQNCFRPLIQTEVKKHLPKTIKENNINLLEIDENLELLSDVLRRSITPGFEEYGLTIPQLYVTNVMLPENDPNFKKLRELQSITLQTKVFEAEAQIKTAHAKAEASVRTAHADIEADVRAKQAEADARAKTAQAEAETRIFEAQAQRDTKKAEAEVGVKVAQRASKLEDEATETELEKRKLEREILAAKAQAEKDLILAQAKAQAEAQATRLTGLADAEVMQAKGLAEAEEMRAKGYTQRDVLQADVQKSYAEALGNMEFGGGTVIGGGSGVGGLVGDMVSLGAGMAVAGKIAQPMSNMISSFQVPEFNANNNQASESCPSCGASVSANAKFCPECGEKIVRMAENEMICPSCGQKTAKGKFCQECGASLIRKCTGCGAELPNGAKFCLECGTKQ